MLGRGPISPGRCNEHAYRHLDWLICSGMLRAGDTLPSERLLGLAFDISRGSVRMALDRLKQDGAIRTGQGKSTLIIGKAASLGTPLPSETSAVPAPKVLSVIEQARRLMSVLVIDAELCQVEQAAVRRLGLLAAMQQDSRDLPQFVIVDRQFHAKLQTCCGIHKLAPLLGLTNALTHGGLRDVFEAEVVRRKVVEHHLAIVSAVERKDLSAAVTALCDQLEMRLAACLVHECETPESGYAKSKEGAVEATPLQEVLGIWRHCGDSS